MGFPCATPSAPGENGTTALRNMSVRARRQALEYIGARDYRGVVSSHSWADDPSRPHRR